jgi:hypothetical protein
VDVQGQGVFARRVLDVDFGLDGERLGEVGELCGWVVVVVVGFGY